MVRLLNPKFLTLIITVLVLISAVTMVVAFNDDLSIVINSWIEGKPRMLIKLKISLPHVEADYCGLIVLRFPTTYNPTKTGYAEMLYKGLHSPGDTVIVSNFLFAMVTKYELDSRTSEYRVSYYEPQEYAVLVVCDKNEERIFKWVKIIEVFPRSILHTEDIIASSEESLVPKTSYSENVETISVEETSFPCNIVIEEEDYSYKRGSCYTWIKGPQIYSIAMLQASFGVIGRKPSSAVYLEGFADSDTGIYLRDESKVEWVSAGKKITSFLISRETSPISGYYKDRVYFYVRYVYEWGWGCWDGFAGVCYEFWLLYPYEIGSVARTAEESSLPNEYSPWIPPQVPAYACPGHPGSTEIYFRENETPDEILASTSITLNYQIWGPVSLSVSFYKAVRSDDQYDTPYIKIYSYRNYWWWYKNDDKKHYEIFLAPRT